MSYKDYWIVEGNDDCEVHNKVVAMMEHGWEVTGGISVVAVSEDIQHLITLEQGEPILLYSQAMVHTAVDAYNPFID